MRYSLDYSWMDRHLEEFVRPYLGHIPAVPKIDKSKPSGAYGTADYHIRTWTPFYFRALLGTWREAWRQARIAAKPILLAGRDTWLLEVAARLHGHPTDFRPHISSYVATHYEKHPPEDFDRFYLVDTGYSGSIPRKLKIRDWHLISYSYSSGSYTPSCDPKPLPPGASQRHQSVEIGKFHGPWGGHQLFPRAKNGNSPGPNVRGIASLLEGSPKYWNCGAVENGKVLPQTFVTKKSFEEAAMFTMFIWENISGRSILRGRNWIGYVSTDNYYNVGMI